MKQKIDTIAFLFGLVLILSGCSTFDIPTPNVSTIDVTSITEMTAVAGGIISTDNGSIISARGVCWSTSPNPTIEDNKLNYTGESPNSFTCNLTGLSPITTYYVRAFATNGGGTAYGEQVTFITNAFELTTIPPTFITATTAISGGMVSFDSDRPDAVSRGVCWNEFPNATTSDNKTFDGVGKGSFTSTMTGLKPFTTYYVRAYISNIEGTRFGNELNFTTQNGVIGIVTDAVASITTTTVTFYGSISGDGGAQITERGFCWSKTTNPTISDTKVVVGSGTGIFTKGISGLDTNTKYYVRAYATNFLGTVYGNEQIFTTLAGVPKACFECASNVGYKVTFTNCSEYPTSCLWDFGDGTSSIENAPTHVYNSIGTYTIKLTVSNEGLSDFATKTVVVSDIVNLEYTPIEWYNGLLGKYIDVDSDGKKDFFVYGYSHTGPSQSTSEKSIMPLGNYGIVYDSINVDVWDSYYNPANYSKKYYTPKKFMLGNTIFSSEKTTTNNIRFSFSSNSYYSRTSYNSWDKDEVRYIGYVNKIGNKTKIGWIKLNLFGSISLYSFKIPIEGTSLLIDN